MSREPLTADQRAALAAAVGTGDESSLSEFDEGCVIGCRAAPDRAAVFIDTFGCRSELSPDEARREAAALLAAADHAEFGPGEWFRGEWQARR